MARPRDPSVRIRLLAAAEAEFVKHGLDDAKIEDITARAKASKGAFYSHFSSKDEAFRELIESVLARLSTCLADCPARLAVAAESGDLTTFLDLWVTTDVAMFEFIWQNRGLCSLLMEGGRGATYRYLIDAFTDQAAEQTRQILAYGIRAGLYRDDLDLPVAGAFIGGAYDRLARDMIRQQTKPDLRAWMMATQALILRGMGTERVREALASQLARPILTRDNGNPEAVALSKARARGDVSRLRDKPIKSAKVKLSRTRRVTGNARK